MTNYEAQILIRGISTLSPDEQNAVSEAMSVCMEPLSDAIEQLFGAREFIVQMTPDVPIPPALGIVI